MPCEGKKRVEKKNFASLQDTRLGFGSDLS